MKPSRADSDRYSKGPCYPELVAVLLAGLFHVVTELAFSASVARVYNVIVSVAFIGYLVWRVRRSKDALRAWGMRTDNFWPALGAQLIFCAVGVVGIIVYGVATDSLELPKTFWLTLALYPIWSIAQQFALQNMIARNVAGFLSSPIAVAVVASVLFAAAHYPVLWLVALTAAAGVPWTWIYRRHPNLWAVGIAHAILGSLAVYIVVGMDPGAAILEFLTGR